MAVDVPVFCWTPNPVWRRPAYLESSLPAFFAVVYSHGRNRVENGTQTVRCGGAGVPRLPRRTAPTHSLHWGVPNPLQFSRNSTREKAYTACAMMVSLAHRWLRGCKYDAAAGWGGWGGWGGRGEGKCREQRAGATPHRANKS